MPNSINLNPGAIVYLDNDKYQITNIIDLDKVLARHCETGQYKNLDIYSLKNKDNQEGSIELNDLSIIDDKDWATANQRFQWIKPLLTSASNKIEIVKEIANAAKVHPATVYRWVNIYQDSGLVSSLRPQKKTGGKNKSRLTPEIEALLNTVIEEHYLTVQKKTPQAVIDEMKLQCRKANIKCPHPNTIRNRINNLSSRQVAKGRRGNKFLREHIEPTGGEFPHADWPLAVIQIDHTKLDIILVDDQYRLPIGRPWITLAMDVYSRMVTGFFVSFDSPSANTVGLCLSHSILPKDEWLNQYKTESDWPVWGLMRTVHADNAKEFRGNVLRRACNEYGIDLEWRPVGRPNFGAHIERILGTFSKQIHQLPGTTFSNITDRAEYKSDQNSALTLSEFEEWFTHLIVDVYHQKIHSSIKCSPLHKYREGILGSSTQPGHGLPSKVADPTKLSLDFMPFYERTVQRDGITLDEITYFDDVLRRWVNSLDPDSKKAKRKFIVRRDPRNISKLHFFDPEINCYFDIPYRNPSRPQTTIWEWNEAKEKLKADGLDNIDENIIFRALEKMREIENKAVKTTKTKRRKQARKKQLAQPSQGTVASINRSSNVVALPVKDEFDIDLSQITPFDELED
jgi:putative transposase